MLTENGKREVAKEVEYSSVFNYFHDEYTNMLKNFLQRHDVKLKEDDCLINYIIKTRFFMPKYSAYTIPITNAMYNENVPTEMKYELMINSYKTIKDAFEQ